MSGLFSPLTIGELELSNRIVMAPMTRNRAGDGNVPQAINATYYRQRAGAGLIITEASQVSPQGQGYPATPGIHSAEQAAGWRDVTDAVHEAGGRIFLQLWHVGRISHPDWQPGGAKPVAPSAIKPEGEKVFSATGPADPVTPRALETSEVPEMVEQFRHGAVRAAEAGFDGVEIHAANGYLIDQFLRDGTNHRKDRYGGSVENRGRFLREVTEAVIGAWGPERVGVRLSPANRFNRMHDSDPQASFGHYAEMLSDYGLAFLHVVETDETEAGFDFVEFRRRYDGRYMANAGYTRERGEQAIESGHADLVSYGTLYLANPDLPARFRADAELNEPDEATFYGGDAAGYTDYPRLKTAAAA